MSEDVHEGEDGWLFLTGGLNRPLLMYGRDIRHAWLLRRWAWLLTVRAWRCRRRGIRYLHLPVPEKLGVYADKAPALAIDPRRGFGSRLRRLLGRDPVCLDAAAALTLRRAGGETFLRTDSHWSSEGCRVAHDVICEALGAAPGWSLADRDCLKHEDFVGDLGSKLEPPRGETLLRHMVLRNAVRIRANALVERYEQTEKAVQLHRGTQVVFRNDAAAADPRRLVVFGDSYSHFASHGLAAMLAESFREVHFIWSVAIDWGYVDRVRPDVLLTEIAERFMVVVPSDRGFDVEALAASRLRELDLPAPA